MVSKKFILTVVTFIALLKCYCQGFCIPCPAPGLTFSSFEDCDCPLGKFYNSSTKACVQYSDCPLYPYTNPLEEIKALSPAVHQILSNALDYLNPNKKFVNKDAVLWSQALQKRIEDIKESMPTLLGPIVGTIAMKNNDLLQICKGNFVCVIKEILKREDNYDLIFPKVKPVWNEVIKKFYKIFDELKVKADESCGPEQEECPLIKLILKFKEVVPGDVEEYMDIIQIAKKIERYLKKYYKSQLNSKGIDD